MSRNTPLFHQHTAANAKLVDFAGWHLPIHYGSAISEHAAVRENVGVFDISHMTIIDLHGADTRAYLRHLFANDVAKLSPDGSALYSCMLNEHGGVIDDLIVYAIDDNHYRTIVNAATHDKDWAWMQQQAHGFDVELSERDTHAMIAVQGPNARDIASPLLDQYTANSASLRRFQASLPNDVMVARTGYTGEDGFEIAAPPQIINELWSSLLEAGATPCGLAARDSLRLEAGMTLYGNDLDEDHTPFASGLKWTVDLSDDARDFIGKSALRTELDNGCATRMIGIILEDKGILRHDQVIEHDGTPIGTITSGGYSPTLERSIGLARIENREYDSINVSIRGKSLALREVKYPFIQNGISKI